ncbi:UDP-4-amino-4,6-dideoxy-N-acetyl-beta-L-altrosamine transaminase [Formivibrio citricus]|uniref:UDP-4-amino-4, 6-dideoxy-N-acetyl-beta-L-altrosamine transaminase n=1 Tax=Formivibrio citricus TaxID=83765 RepID=UPI000B820FC5|nr:UDP-4-amino-4,6-dideoxy-N-acetyl-beta-L-altrosamine transaminase [Formivibrio citricus]
MKTKRSIPYGHQSIDDADIAAVEAVLRSDWLTQGPAIARFEAAVAARCGARYAVAVCNATAALHIACLAMGIKPGDRVWTSPNTFVASANCARYCGAVIDFVDIDPDTLNLSVDKLAKKLAEAERAGRLPQLLIPVHFAGQSCDMANIRQLADRYGFRLLEDASHAIGGSYRGLPVGACSFSDAAVFSFHPVKIITTGEGGMVVTNDEKLYRQLLLLRSHGITRDPDLMEGENEGAWYYQQVALGFNYRMTDMQAALGESQMIRLDGFVARRRELVARYQKAFADAPIQLQSVIESTDPAWHLFIIQTLRPEQRRPLFNALRAAGIGVNVHYIPVHTQPDFGRLGFRRGDFPYAEDYYERAISLPLYAGLSDEDQDYVIEQVLKGLRG